ncbi:hypothetical protein [Candidatus Vidania fulgoroideorum]
MFCLIGKNVKKTLSPIIYKHFFSKSNKQIKYHKISCKINFFYINIIFFLKTQTVINITIPYKETVIVFGNFLSNRVKKTNSSNLLLINNNTLYCYTTDGLGFLKTFNKIKEKKKYNIFLFGAGGAAKSIIYELKKKLLHIYNRNQKKINIIKKYIKHDIKLIKNKTIKNSLIINTIPENFFYKIIKNHQFVFLNCFFYDIGYKTKNKVNFNGLNMLYLQGAQTYKIFKQYEKKITMFS